MTLQSLLTVWSFDPLVVCSLVATALLYLRGVAYTTGIGLGPRLQWWQITCFFLGLLVVFIALQSEIDIGAGELLWIHMVQHDLLTMVAPPLLLLGSPGWIIWRAIPAAWRRGLLLEALRLRWPWRLGHTLGRAASNPPLVLALFLGDFLIWHIPVFYDLTLYNHNIHIGEHLLFLGTALLFWAQIIPTNPQRRPVRRQLDTKATTKRLSYPQQVLYVACAALVLNVLGGIFVFSVGPIYEYYATLIRTPGMPSVVVDQHYAGALMDIPGTIIFFTTMMILLGLWLVEDDREAQAESSLAGYRSL
ncbi:MAG: cytochrome c oxidase assembly protein [Ktedonobacterales bacterium]